MQQASDDPIARWYQLIRFVSVEQREKLKGRALASLTMREGAMMIGLLYKDLYGSDLLLSFSSTWS